MDITTYFEPFFKYLKDIRGYSPQTLKTYKLALDLLKDYYEIEQKDDIFILNIMAFRLKLKNHSKSSISTKLSAVRSFVKYLKKYHNINIKLKGAQSVKIAKTLPKPIDKNSIFEALNYCSLQERLIIKLLYGLGLRVSELASLKLENISKNWIRVRGKGNKTRQIPLLDSLYREILEYQKKYLPKVYLFEKDGKPLSDQQLRYRVNTAFKKIGIKATPHQLRHSFASDLLFNGARIADVSELLGHSSMATTQIYTKLTNSTKLQNYLNAHPLAKDD